MAILTRRCTRCRGLICAVRQCQTADRIIQGLNYAECHSLRPVSVCSVSLRALTCSEKVCRFTMQQTLLRLAVCAKMSMQGSVPEVGELMVLKGISLLLPARTRREPVLSREDRIPRQCPFQAVTMLCVRRGVK